MDITKIIQIIKILEDRAITPDEGAILIDAIVQVLNQLRPQLKKWYMRIVLDGVKVSLMELKEHLEDIK